jgi:hypothetical protein
MPTDWDPWPGKMNATDMTKPRKEDPGERAGPLRQSGGKNRVGAPKSIGAP